MHDGHRHGRADGRAQPEAARGQGMAGRCAHREFGLKRQRRLCDRILDVAAGADPWQRPNADAEGGSADQRRHVAAISGGDRSDGRSSVQLDV